MSKRIGFYRLLALALPLLVAPSLSIPLFSPHPVLDLAREREPASVGARPEEYRIEGRKVHFVRQDSRRLLISASCLGAGTAPARACMALQVLRRLREPASISMRSRSAASRSTAARGVALCLGRAEGSVVKGIDSSGKENGFCRFSDGSLIDLGSLDFNTRGFKP